MVMPCNVLISGSVKAVPRKGDVCVSERDGENKMGKEKIKN